jgi:hypothetical protein
MAVLIEAFSVVIRRDAVEAKYPGGIIQFINDGPNNTLCMDRDIVRVGFMAESEANDFIESLKRDGFRCEVNGEGNEIALVEQFRGVCPPCDWLEFLQLRMYGYQEVSACNLKGGPFDGLSIPKGDTSFSKNKPIVTNETEFRARMTFLRHEGNCDVYFDKLTGKELYIGRTSRRTINS